jgi:hypothetical protein
MPPPAATSTARRADPSAAGRGYGAVDSAWVKRLAALLRILRLVLLLLAATLGTVVVAVIFNTIRLQVLTQREEIEVPLIGATDSFIHRPSTTPAPCWACARAPWRWRR